MARRALRIGLIGAGSIAAYHIDGTRAAGDQVHAIAAGSKLSAKQAALRFGIPHACTSWQELLARDDLDAVIIATPDDTHEDIALAAISARIPGMIQKPLATTRASALRIVAAGRSAGIPVFTSYMHRHFPETARWHAVMAGDDNEPAFLSLGPILSVRIRNATPGPDWGDWFYDGVRSGGVVMQIGIHGIDLVEHLIGPITEVTAMTALRRSERLLADGRLIRPTSDDHAFAVYRTAGDVIISHEMCYSEVAGTDRFLMEITCERAKIVFRGHHGALAVNAGDGWKAIPVGAATAGAAQHALFSDMVRGNLPHDISDLAGIQGLLVAEAINASAASGRAMEVPRASKLLETLLS
jgi:UDP-N-acetyl-2-amino-2-deoxyglucuronate dehydrogenase